MKSESRIVAECRGAKPGALYGKSGEVSGTIRVIEGVTESGIPFRTTAFTPDRTPEEQAAWEARTRAAVRTFVGDCIREMGYERARELLEVK